jgi:(2Fe-2S) ferredoxin
MGDGVRCIYDDRKKFPWVIVYGDGKVWATFRSREAAMRVVKKLLDVISTYA